MLHLQQPNMDIPPGKQRQISKGFPVRIRKGITLELKIPAPCLGEFISGLPTSRSSPISATTPLQASKHHAMAPARHFQFARRCFLGTVACQKNFCVFWSRRRNVVPRMGLTAMASSQLAPLGVVMGRGCPIVGLAFQLFVLCSSGSFDDMGWGDACERLTRDV